MAVQGYHSRHDFWNGLEAAMKPWMKIAIGCLAVSILGLFLLVAGLVGFGYWAKNRVEEFTGGGPEVQEARKKANAVPFHRPAGDVIEEPRFVKYIEVRASVYTVYEKYKGELESRMAKIKQGQSLDFGDISTGFTLMGELQRAETLALAKHGMSEDEYAFVNGEVYKSMWTDLGGGEASKQAIRQATRQAAEAMKGIDPTDLPPEAREAIARARSEIEKGTREASTHMENVTPNAANVALFKKYEADLKKYAMPALQFFFEGSEADQTEDAEATPPPKPSPTKT